MASYPVTLPHLTEEELDLCRKAFQMFDKDGSGTIAVNVIKYALNALGQTPSDDELFVMISQVDEDGSNEIEFSQFVQAIQMNKMMSEKNTSEQDTIDAFVALGGNVDKTGRVDVARLRGVIEEFELTLNLDKLVGDGEGKVDIDYDEFRALLA